MNNNPVRYNDPSGHVVACDKDDWACQHHWDEPITYDTKDYEIPLTKKKKRVVEFLLNASEFVATTAFEPLDWIMMAGYCAEGDCSPWMLAGLLPLIPSSAGKYLDDAIELIPSSVIHWSQEGISAISTELKNGQKLPWMYLDDLATDMAQGWKGDPLRVLDVNGKLVSLDNRRLTVAKMLGIDVPVTIQKSTYGQLLSKFGRDGIFTQIPIRGTNIIIDMFGGLK